LGTPKGRYDEHSSKSFLSCETKVIESVGEKPHFRRLMPTSFATLQQWRQINAGAKLFTSSNMKPAHNTTKYFAPTYDDVVNLTGLL
jgi:hypothetical protein